MSLKIGDNAPDFSLPTSNNGNIALSDLKGKKVILYFYPKDMTSGCTVEARDFSCSKADFDSVNTVIIGVSKDSPKSHDKFIEKEDLNFVLVSDEDTSLHQKYGAWVEKSMYGKKYMGADRSTFLIDEKGIIRHIWRNVKVPGHVEEVLEKSKSI